MSVVRAILYGIPQQKYEPQKFINKRKKVEYIKLLTFLFDSNDSFEETKIKKYTYLIHPRKRREIEQRFNLKIPLFIRKLVWKLEEIVS